jgi:hypothetical protein
MNVDVACLAAAAQQAIDEIVIPATTHLLAA